MMPELPIPEDVLEMEPEELAPFILLHLKSQPKNSLNRYNFTLSNDVDLSQKLGTKYQDYLERLMEALMWLEREGFIAPRPGQQGDWMFITRKGEKVLDAEDFIAYQKSSLFPSHIDPILVRNIKPLFIRGDYDTAIFRVFKEVEVRVRKKSNLGNEKYGIDLMKEAFGTGGPLEDVEAPKGERDRLRDLFVGAIGVFKNPSSHREINFDDPTEVIDIICFANQLLRMIERK